MFKHTQKQFTMLNSQEDVVPVDRLKSACLDSSISSDPTMLPASSTQSSSTTPQIVRSGHHICWPKHFQ